MLLGKDATGLRGAIGSLELSFWAGLPSSPIMAVNINSSGNVGIGTINPSAKLHISGSGGWSSVIRIDNTTGHNWSMYASGNSFMINDETVFLHRIVLDGDGNVGIGTNTPGCRLDVVGGIRADSIVINSSGADFVFDENYNLQSLVDIEQYIKENKHLPDIPPAVQMQKEGVSVGSIQTKLLQKVEELTLYMIEQDKRIRKLEEENKILKQRK